MALPDYVLTPIDKIDIGERYRKEPEKDLDKLTASIDELGLLHPIVITPENKLIAGQRRILAYQALGMDEIEAHVIHDLDDAGVLLGEADENTCRVPFSMAEARALYKRRKALLAPLAKESQKTGLKQGDKTPSGARLRTGRAADAAAAGTGKSRFTLDHVEKIQTISQDESLPGSVRELANAKLSAVEADQEPVKTALAEVNAAVAQAKSYRYQAKTLAAAVGAVGKHAAALEAVFIGADNFDPDTDIDTVQEGFKAIRAAVTRINKVSKEIQYIGEMK